MSRPSRSGAIVPILAVLLCAGALALLLTRSYPLERSAIGFRGLETWLGRSGVAVRRLPPPPGDADWATTLRILPVYDNDMDGGLSRTLDLLGGEDEDTRSRLGPLSPRDMSRDAFEARVAEGTTLVILPKWRGGIVSRGRAHPDLLIPLGDIWFLDVAEILRRPEGEPIREWAVADLANGGSPGRATLYAPQVLGSGFDDVCEPTWQVEGVGTLLSWCEDLSESGFGFFVLSDPDLLDNHGLSLGTNAALAVSMMQAIAPDTPVFVDPGGEAAPEAASDGGEDFADPARFFRYPFSLAWFGVALLLLLALWRGNVRFGPVRSPAAFRRLRSKEDTIQASGRLMRLAGGEGELIRAYALSRMETLRDRLLGSRARLGAPADPGAAVFGFLDRRAPELGVRVNRAYRDLVEGEGATSGASLDAFEHVFQEILDEFGRASRPSRGDRR